MSPSSHLDSLSSRHLEWSLVDERGWGLWRTRAGRTIAAFKATHSMAVASLNASRRRDNSRTKLNPAFPLGTSNKLRLQ